MSIKRVLHYGEASLREKSKEVHKVSRKITDLVRDLFDTMYANNGVGLAAPQIGVNLRVFVIDASTKEEPLDPMVFINPKIIKKSGAVKSNEGCLSFPGAYTDVVRYKDILVKALNEHGKTFVMEVKGGSLLARAIQHENDHLDGVLFIDHCLNRFETEETLKKSNLPNIDPDLLLEETELKKQL
ncbi:peptide deformylase [bacterium]|nr:peptide deformylase [bacterium]